MFKNNKQEGVDYKQKREQFAQNIRKTNRQEIFSKKRNILIQHPESLEIETSKLEKQMIVDPRYHKEISLYLKTNYTMDNFHELARAMHDPDILKQHYGTIGIRKILSVHQQPPIQPVIDAGLVPKMIELVKQEEFPQLQLEATWALTNVASGTTIQCQSIIDKGGISLFISLLSKTNAGILEQAIWAIGNIASDCTFHRDQILRQGGMASLIKIAGNTDDQTITKHLAWTISNLCRGSPLPKYDLVKDAIPVLCQFVIGDQIDDQEILSDLCWAISYNCENNRQRIQKVINTQVTSKIVNFLSRSFLPLLVPSLRIVGNISTGDAHQTEQIMKFDVLSRLQNLLDHQKKVVRRETCWVISNIAAGNRQQVQAIMNRPTMLQKLINIFGMDVSDIKKEVCYIFSNMSYGAEVGSLYQMYKSHDIVTLYVGMLGEKDDKAVEISLECLFLVLTTGEKIKSINKMTENPLVEDLLNSGAIDIIEKLQFHQSEMVYNNTVKILTRFFQIEDSLAN